MFDEEKDENKDDENEEAEEEEESWQNVINRCIIRHNRYRKQNNVKFSPPICTKPGGFFYALDKARGILDNGSRVKDLDHANKQTISSGKNIRRVASSQMTRLLIYYEVVGVKI